MAGQWQRKSAARHLLHNTLHKGAQKTPSLETPCQPEQSQHPVPCDHRKVLLNVNPPNNIQRRTRSDQARLSQTGPALLPVLERARSRLYATSIRLERFRFKCCPLKIVRGGIFLRKMPLGVYVSVKSRIESAVVFQCCGVGTMNPTEPPNADSMCGGAAGRKSTLPSAGLDQNNAAKKCFRPRAASLTRPPELHLEPCGNSALRADFSASRAAPRAPAVSPLGMM